MLVSSVVLEYYPKDWCGNCEEGTGYRGWDVGEDRELGDTEESAEVLVLFFCANCGKVKTVRGMEWIEDEALLEEIVWKLGRMLGEEERDYGDLSEWPVV